MRHQIIKSTFILAIFFIANLATAQDEDKDKDKDKDKNIGTEVVKECIGCIVQVFNHFTFMEGVW